MFCRAEIRWFVFLFLCLTLDSCLDVLMHWKFETVQTSYITLWVCCTEYWCPESSNCKQVPCLIAKFHTGMKQLLHSKSLVYNQTITAKLNWILPADSDPLNVTRRFYLVHQTDNLKTCSLLCCYRLSKGMLLPNTKELLGSKLIMHVLCICSYAHDGSNYSLSSKLWVILALS